MSPAEACLRSYSRAANRTIQEMRKQPLTERGHEVKVRRLHMLVARHQRDFFCVCHEPKTHRA